MNSGNRNETCVGGGLHTGYTATSPSSPNAITNVHMLFPPIGLIYKKKTHNTLLQMNDHNSSSLLDLRRVGPRTFNFIRCVQMSDTLIHLRHKGRLLCFQLTFVSCWKSFTICLLRSLFFPVGYTNNCHLRTCSTDVPKPPPVRSWKVLQTVFCSSSSSSVLTFAAGEFNCLLPYLLALFQCLYSLPIIKPGLLLALLFSIMAFTVQAPVIINGIK
jgi:hypothetical protein